ncbi:hypothetical protein V3470_13705 [Flavobacterium oreochromis]|uniref:DUF2726 domain-containing protein n=1 Tax=Flavobacterium oreochromis TaxID=2906078 RepID=A0ABW8PBV0_9FLAO|nr:hypothetical protein [Flavobacterium oreochromis]OWP75195.1 hypothetical protein BWG23_11685 [Flavobacterium oreochromis]
MKKLTTADFIKRAIMKHQNNFNYDKVVYLNAKSKVIITCKKHGDFEQMPYDHLRGNGCLECNGRKKITKEEFIEKANKVHNHNFIYDKVVYLNNKAKVIITCRKHGDFEQIPANHLKGNGCLDCSGLKRLSPQEFIEKANKVHNYKFNYDKVKYINRDTKVIITCRKHGDFKQIPRNHLNGNGCIMCNRQKTTTQEFIEKANKVHNHNFIYDKVAYVNNSTKIIITCRKHGDFEQIPANHIKGHGCLDCSGLKKKTTKEFIEKANKIHNYNYNYDKVAYLNSTSKVIITCKKHGDFEQIPNDHLNGSGCDECKRNKISIQEFIEKANKIHNNNFIYDKVAYLNKSTKVIITCKKHGDFKQTPNDHLKGHGCLQCSGLKKKTTQEFTEKANKVHNYKFNYDKVAYVNNSTKIIITCKKHGDFEQIPNDHLNGSGCQKCKSSRGEKHIYEVLQKLNIKYESQYKFDDCIHKRRLPFDFAVFLNDKVGLIEFHGEQHYKLNKFFHSKSKIKYKEYLTRDKIKEEYAKSNNIDLLIIPYYEIFNIELLINDFIKKLSSSLPI